MVFFSRLKRSTDAMRDENPASSAEENELDVLNGDKNSEEPQDNPKNLASDSDNSRGEDSIEERRKEKRFGDLLKPIIQKILTSESISEIIFTLTDDIRDLFNCDAVTIYAIDRAKRELFSRNHRFDEVEEIRLSISPKSLAGFVAATGKTLNIADAYDKNELSKIHKDLQVDSSWDKKFSYKTRSVVSIALAHSKRMMGVLELINKKDGESFSETDVRIAKDLSNTLGNALVKLELEDIEKKLQETSHAIHSAATIDEILLELKIPILQLFDTSLITIYAVDTEKNQIYSKIKSGNAISEIRVPVSAQSISGCVAQERRLVNIEDVYNDGELKRYHPDLTFDSSWDKKSGLKTKSMLVVPLLHADKLMGVLQLVNKKHVERFTAFDEKNARIIADTLALAFFNQQKLPPPKRTKFGYLVDNGIISQDELNAVIQKARTSRVDIEHILLGEIKISRQEIGKSLELYYNIPYNGYSDSVVLPPQVFSGLNKNYLAKNNWVPLLNEPDQAVILVDDPSNPDKTGNIKMIFPKKKLEFRVGLKADIRDYLNSALTDDDQGGGMDTSDNTAGITSLLTDLQDEKAESTETSQEDEAVNAISETDSTIVKLVNKILIDAYNAGISDIHIEPGTGKKNIKVRFRKDGACKVYQEIPYLYKQAILSRIKIMSKLDIAEKRLPQDGKIKMRYGSKEIEYRVATCPTVGGNEDAVLRILAASKPIPLDKMNFFPRNEQLIKDKCTKPYGLILVVGPTGSGKTTTLHSCLGFINTPERKIWTAEDPVEITQDGLRQVQMLNKIGLDFARAMKSFLRGDPDVIMVGEMRDSETCAIGLEASLTGHLVFSTLHTNSAPETITRLLDMGMNPLNFADALLLIVAQRLVRTLCKNCKEAYHPTREEYDTLVKEYGKDFDERLSIPYTDDLMLKKAVGCAKCDNTGYAGRTGIHELLDGTDDIKRMIMQKSYVEDLRKQAIQDGMTTLKQDGIYKIFKGDCDLKQVMSVCIV